MSEHRGAANAEQAYRWNGEGGRYWIDHRERLLAGHRNLHRHLFRGAAITGAEQVLDVGCGCGGTTLRAARTADRVVGLDLSGPMLAVARGLAGQVRAANTAFVRGDAQDSPLRPASFDVLISSFGVMFFADLAAAFASLARVARPGGRLAFLCWQYELDNDYFAIPLRAFAALMPLPGPTPAGRIFADPARLTGLLSGAGWADVRIESLTEPSWLGADTADVMSFIRVMPRLRTLVAGLADDAKAERAWAATAEQYAARQQPDGVWVEAAAFLVTARRS
jgi:ubiquinone/menaquinone biosynthesis C-methylase UbiE